MVDAPTQTNGRTWIAPGPSIQRPDEGVLAEIGAQCLQCDAAVLRRGSFQPGRAKWQL